MTWGLKCLGVLMGLTYLVVKYDPTLHIVNWLTQ